MRANGVEIECKQSSPQMLTLQTAAGSPFSCFSVVQPGDCLQGREVQGVLPPAGKTRKSTKLWTRSPTLSAPPPPPGAYLQAVGTAGSIQVKSQENPLCSMFVIPPRSCDRHSKNSRLSRTWASLTSNSKRTHTGLTMCRHCSKWFTFVNSFNLHQKIEHFKGPCWSAWLSELAWIIKM